MKASNNTRLMLKASMLLAILPVATMAVAQDTVKRKTIDITSSFKPSLIQQQKLGLTASAAPADSVRPRLQYSIPSQNLAFGFSPAPLRPMAFQADSNATADRPGVYVKAGYGNFQTPYLKALASFGNGVKSNGNLEGHYLSSKGQLPYQQFSQFGAKANLWLHMKQNNSLHLFGGLDGSSTYRYGFGEKPAPPEDSLKLRYTTATVGAALANAIGGENGVSYNGKLDAHFFSDNQEGQEVALRFDVPVTKQISDNAALTLGIKGMVSNLNGRDTSFGNNLFMIPVQANLQLKEGLTLYAGIIPSWNNKAFALLPDVKLEYLLNQQNMSVEAGVRGYYDENTFRSLAATNPWMQQPTQLTNTRNLEAYAALKANVNEFLSYRAKLGVGKQYNVPLWVNDAKDGREFELQFEPSLSRFFLAGELVYQKGQRFRWSNSLQINGYSSLKVADKAFGLLPMELRSSVNLMILKDLRFKADLYSFSGAWYRPVGGGDSKRGKSVLDLNAGVEFDVTAKLKLWLQLNNIANMDYQRWHQYRVLGFQALGGIIFHL